MKLALSAKRISATMNIIAPRAAKVQAEERQKTEGNGVSLGTYANSSSAPAEKSSFERYKRRFLLQGSARFLLPGERVAKCLRYRIPIKTTIDCYYSPEVAKGHIKNLQVCNSVWACAVCGSKISERRRLEFVEVLEKFLKESEQNSNVMVTLTLAHSRNDSLQDVQSGLMAALGKFKGSRVWSRIKDDYGWVGDTRAQECTWGARNGFHPHVHILGFLDNTFGKQRFEAFEGECKAHWLNVLEKCSMSGSWEYALHVRGTDSAAGDYIHKAWGIEREMTKGVVKLGRGDNRSVAQLLLDYSDRENVAGCTWQQSGAIWREYALTYKGKRQNEWGRGINNMRQRLGLTAEKTDEELNTEEDENSLLIASLFQSHFDVILANDAMAEFKSAIDTGEASKIWDLVYSLQKSRVG